MKNYPPIFRAAAFLLGSLVFVCACAPVAQPAAQTAVPTAEQPTPSLQTFSDPFTYCAAVGTVDQPDERYTGELKPQAIFEGFIRASGANPDAEMSDAFKEMTIWRCMDSQVYVCNFGANLPCDSKANTDKTPTQAMNDFCKQNPDSEFIPMAVTGHDTIYSWRCAKDTAEVQEAFTEADAAGFIKNIWYPLEAEK